MDPRQIIRLAVTHESYGVSGHAYDEAGKDGISLEMVERVMCYGVMRKRERLPDGAVRYTLRSGEIMVVVEVSDDEVVVITTGRER